MARSRALAPRMVGRQSQVAALEEQLRLASAGAGRAVLVTGEAGVGKTRLVRTFLERPRETPAIDVVAGYCYEEDTRVPYAPFVGVLRQMVREQGRAALSAAVGPWAADLLRLLPDPDAAPVPRDDGDAPQERKHRLFEAVYRLVRPGSGGRCRIVVLEDLHWADESCYELIRFLARAGERDRLLILGTYRSEAARGHRPLVELVAQLTRERRADEIRLAPLSLDELARMLESMIERPLPTALVDALHDHTGGNPFFLEEVVGALIDQDRLEALIRGAREGRSVGQLIVPLSLKVSILSRVGDLDATAMATLTAAAVVGRLFDFDLLQRLTRLDEPTLVRAIAALVARQLVVEETDGSEDRYAFRHALTREAIYGDMLGRERRLRHRAVLEALEALHADEPEAVIDQLAYHSLHARDLVRAASYARLAGARAMRMSAYREAVTHYRVALDLLNSDDPRDRADLYDLLAEAAYPLGEADLCLTCWREALRLYTLAGNRPREADIHRRLGRVAWERGASEEALAHTRAAIAILEAAPPGRELALAYSALSQQHMLSSHSRDAITWGEKALALADELGETGVRAHALNNVGCALCQLGDLPRGLAALDESLALARHHDLTYDAMRACQNLADVLIHLGEFRRAAEVAAEGITLAERAGWRSHRSELFESLATAQVALGRWDEADAVLDRTIRATATELPVEQLFAMTTKIELLVCRGRLDDALRLIEEIRSRCEAQGELLVLGRFFLALAHIHRAQGDHERAAVVLDRGVALWDAVGNLVAAPLVLYNTVEHYLAAGRERDARQRLETLIALAGRAPTPLALAYLADARGLLAVYEGRAEAAAEHFHQAIVRWQGMGCPYEVARTRLRWAESSLACGPREGRKDAITALLAARDAFARLGAPLDVAAADAVLKRQGQPVRTSPAASGGGALTPREREVLALLVRGRSNQAIADELFISRKTTETHVSNILGKLGCATRTEAAVLAVAQGLAALDA